MEKIKNALVGMAFFGVLFLIGFLWIGIPMMFFTVDTPKGLEITPLGVVWIFGPVVIIILSVFSWIGKDIRETLKNF